MRHGRPPLASVSELDQLPRLQQYRADHPRVVIGRGEFDTWQAWITGEDSETIIVRHTLRELLDRLGEPPQ